MKVMITGREGQLARSLAQRAAGRGDLQLSFAARPAVDLRQPGDLAAAILEGHPDLVINAAAYTAVDQAEDEPELARRINADAAGEAAGAARQVGAAVVQISTDYVFDGTARKPYGEDHPVRPLGVYGRTKLAGEEQVRAANARHVIIRTAWLYSPFGRNFVKTVVAAAETRPVLRVVDDQVGSPTSALDLADALLRLIETGSPAGATYHVAGPGQTSWFGLAEQVMAECRAVGLPSAAVEPIRTEDWPTRAERPRYSVLDSSKFAADFGLALPTWQSSVRRVVEQLASELAE